MRKTLFLKRKLRLQPKAKLKNHTLILIKIEVASKEQEEEAVKEEAVVDINKDGKMIWVDSFTNGKAREDSENQVLKLEVIGL